MKSDGRGGFVPEGSFVKSEGRGGIEPPVGRGGIEPEGFVKLGWVCALAERMHITAMAMIAAAVMFSLAFL